MCSLRNLFLPIICIVFSISAFADPTDDNGSTRRRAPRRDFSSSDIKASNNQFGIQSISTNLNYTETGNGQLGSPTGTLDTETGPVPGRAYYLSEMVDVLFGNDYFKVAYDQSSGYTNYIGGNLGPPSTPYGSVVSTSGAILTNYSVRYGKGFANQSLSMFTPYIEFGSHKWERGVNYGEIYSNTYYGYGLMAQYLIANKLVFSVDAMYGHTTQSAITVTSGPQIVGFSGALGNSDMYKVGASLDWAVAQRLHVTAGADYTTFNYGISATYPSGSSVAWEPDSKTNYTTVRVGLGWGF